MKKHLTTVKFVLPQVARCGVCGVKKLCHQQDVEFKGTDDLICSDCVPFLLYVDCLINTNQIRFGLHRPEPGQFIFSNH